jgi:uncharacterized protein
MAEQAGAEPATTADYLRDRIIAAPDVVLDDPAVMRALISATESVRGGNVVDLRGIAMERLETRLDRLEDAHRFVLAAAYDNISGMQQVHRAVLALLEPASFDEFLTLLAGEVAHVLRVDRLRLVLEAAQGADDPALRRHADVLHVVGLGFVDGYMGAERGVLLRPSPQGPSSVYGTEAPAIRSEALLRIDLGPGRLPGMLALGSAEGDRFRPGDGTDLLTFLGAAFERALRRWLA